MQIYIYFLHQLECFLIIDLFSYTSPIWLPIDSILSALQQKRLKLYWQQWPPPTTQTLHNSTLPFLQYPGDCPILYFQHLKNNAISLLTRSISKLRPPCLMITSASLVYLPPRGSYETFLRRQAWACLQHTRRMSQITAHLAQTLVQPQASHFFIWEALKYLQITCH